MGREKLLRQNFTTLPTDVMHKTDKKASEAMSETMNAKNLTTPIKRESNKMSTILVPRSHVQFAMKFNSKFNSPKLNLFNTDHEAKRAKNNRSRNRSNAQGFEKSPVNDSFARTPHLQKRSEAIFVLK